LLHEQSVVHGDEHAEQTKRNGDARNSQNTAPFIAERVLKSQRKKFEHAQLSFL
jgi:hypothetical protein